MNEVSWCIDEFYLGVEGAPVASLVGVSIIRLVFEGTLTYAQRVKTRIEPVISQIESDRTYSLRFAPFAATTFEHTPLKKDIM